MSVATQPESPEDRRFQRLREYIEEGWVIDPPIFVRPVWHSRHRTQDAYHFILKRQEALHLLVLPVTPEVDHFVREQQLPLNRL